MGDKVPYLGSRIVLISKSEIRYEGTLYTIDTNNSTVALQAPRQHFPQLVHSKFWFSAKRSFRVFPPRDLWRKTASPASPCIRRFQKTESGNWCTLR